MGPASVVGGVACDEGGAEPVDLTGQLLCGPSLLAQGVDDGVEVARRNHSGLCQLDEPVGVLETVMRAFQRLPRGLVPAR